MYSAPPGLPTVMVLIGRIGNSRLRKERMELTFPEALHKGACADVVAFDKTGTLTHSTVSGAMSCQVACVQHSTQQALHCASVDDTLCHQIHD